MSSVTSFWGALIAILLEPLFWEQVALFVVLKTVLLKEKFWFLLERMSLTTLLEPLPTPLTWMVSCTIGTPMLLPVFLELNRLPPLQEEVVQKT